MGKIDLTYINKQIAAKKAAEGVNVEEVEKRKETLEEFKARWDRELEEVRKARIDFEKRMGI